MATAEAAGKLRGRKPKLAASQEKHLLQLHRTGRHATSDIAELFGVARKTGLPGDPVSHIANSDAGAAGAR